MVPQIAVITGDDVLIDQFRTRRIQPVKITLGDLEGYARVSDAPRSIVIDLRGITQVPPAVPVFCRHHPAARVAFVVKALEPAFMLEAMRAGVSELIPEPITAQVLDDALRRLISEDGDETTGRLIAFVGAKGGVGTTMLAVNTAASLAKSAKNEILLADMHIGFGDAAIMLGVEPRFSVVNALENSHKVDASFFEGLVEKTSSGVHLLASGSDSHGPPVDETRLRALLDAAVRAYKVTVVDMPRNDGAALNALDAAAKIAVVTTHELSSLRHAGQLADRLRQRYGSSRIVVVLNRADRNSTISDTDLERAVGGAVVHRLPSDYRTVIDALNSGEPYVIEAQGRLTIAQRSLAADLAGEPKERTERPSGGLTRLMLRRT